ncbi:SnoaL-like protein [Nocardia tenerifensis]|uniref:SnoaL-like protein n=1 Tax=Nocardia tenerifensis TaxID=228006 RepID=A0A318KCF1_9NOCA|nr:nuclear transport factor 2 family protein [Nocardia tenerifensis]PXX71806.1 SnoaL-like protein [Nocardia tenerifensis]
MPTYRMLENLIYRYADLVDRGDFAGVAELLADATFIGGGGELKGRKAIEDMFRDLVIVYDDGTPKTKHVTTNVILEVDEEAGTARSQSYVTVFQAVEGLSLQPIAAGRYDDRFLRDGSRWRFAERRFTLDLLGEVSRHLRRAVAR